jgi:imidazole glycerol-phosphate synthase subunit HisF
MLRTRIIPALLLRNESLVKTFKFGKFTYVGDPCNTLRIFNELEVDELIFLDIMASRTGAEPNLELLADIANECFMPLGYGGGVRTVAQATEILHVGFEKIVVNSSILADPSLITRLADTIGSQAVIASIDVKRNIWGKSEVKGMSGTKRSGRDPLAWAQEVEALGAGEILLTSIDREGTWDGFDLELVKSISQAVNIPVIAHGGAGSVADIGAVVKQGGASAVALGSLVVFQKKDMGVLVNFPDTGQLKAVLA